MKIVLWLAVAALFLASPNLLYVLGINYMNAVGNPLEKLHPAFYLAAAAACMAALQAGGPREPAVARAAVALLVAGIVALGWTLVAGVDASGAFSILGTTYLTPALLVLVLLRQSGRTLNGLRIFITLFMAVNSLVGIGEALSGETLLPFIAGQDLLGFETRALGLFGHPLTSGSVTGFFCLLLIIDMVRHGLAPVKLGQLALHGTAMLAFGGRIAIVLLVAVVLVYALAEAGRGMLTRRLTRAALRTGALLALAGMAVPVLLASGIADNVLGRFFNDGGSADTRLAAIRMLELVAPEYWLTGVPEAQRSAWQMALGSPYGIEIFAVALVLSYGLPMALLLSWTTFALITRLANRPGGPGWYFVVYFAGIVLSAQSIGGKNLTLGCAVTMLVVMAVPAPARQSRTLEAGALASPS